MLMETPYIWCDRMGGLGGKEEHEKHCSDPHYPVYYEKFESLGDMALDPDSPFFRSPHK